MAERPPKTPRSKGRQIFVRERYDRRTGETNQDVQGALKKLNRFMKDEKYQEDLRARESFEKPSGKRATARSRAASRERRRRAQEMEAGHGGTQIRKRPIKNRGKKTKRREIKLAPLHKRGTKKGRREAQ